MDETENFLMEESRRTRGNSDNKLTCPEENVMQKGVTDEFEFEEAVDRYGIRTGVTPEVAHVESDSTERASLVTKDREKVVVDRACSRSETSRNESFGEEFDATSQDVQENQCNDRSTGNAVNELEKQSSLEISENKVEETTHGSPETAEIRSIYNTGKPHSQGPKHYIPPGWVYHGESDGYRYYVGCAGEMYSVDRDGYWYMQDSTGNFIPYTGYQYNRGAHSSLFPRDSQGRFILPTNARGEKAFPVDTNNMPIFPFDTTTHLPTFPVDENGQPVFPTGALGRPIVPIDSNGLAIFPRDANGRFIFPSGPNGRPTAPVNIYGVPVMPLDEQGKPVVPYDASGTPLIHLASDGMTPLTEEEYQYSLQWNDYYSRYYKNTAEQKVSSSSQSGAQPTTTDDTYEQKAKNMKLLKKVRPEDIDLPPCVPPPPSTQPPPPLPDGSALSGKVEKKATPDPALKAKTKKMIEMQLKFSRKKLRNAVHSSVAVVSSSETTNTSVEHTISPRQPSDSPENIDKVESPKERPPPPPPVHVPALNLCIPPEPDNNTQIKESFNAALDNAPKSMDSRIMQNLNKNPSDDSGVKEKIAVLQTSVQTSSTPCRPQLGPTSVLNVPDNAVKTSGDMAKNFGSPKLFSDLCGNSMNEFQVDNHAFGKEIRTKLDECLIESRDGKITPEKQSEPVLTDVTVTLEVVSDEHPQDKEIIEEEKVATKTRPSVGNSYESKIENQTLRRRDDKNELISASHGKRSEKKMRHRDASKERRRRTESGHRRLRSRSSYRDSHRRSRSRGVKHRSRTRSRTPRDYYCRNRYRSRSRDRFYKHESSYYDRRDRRYWTPDAEDRYSYRRRHSSSRERSSQHERSTSRDLTPTGDKSSRSRSYYERSKSRTESPVPSRHSSVARSISQYKTTDSRNRSSSRRNSAEYDVSQITEHESGKSPRQPAEDVESIDGAIDMHKSTHHSASPRSEKSSVKGLEVKAEKSKKHKKTKEKHRKRRKSHHKKRDKKKGSPFMDESELDEKYKASSVLSEETDLNVNASSNQLADEGAQTVPNKELNDLKNERTKKRKEKKKKKERHNTSTERSDVTKKASQETLEDGEIITEKDVSPRVRGKVVNYATSESEGEDSNTRELKNPIEQLAGNCNTKGTVPSTIKFSLSSKTAESPTKVKEDFNDAEIIRSSVLSFDLVDEALVPPDDTTMSKLGKKAKQNYEPINPKREMKITVDLEDDGISSKLKDLTSDFNEITAREAEKLKAGNITEAVNKLKELRGYVKSKVAVSNSSTETEAIKQFNTASGSDSAYAGHSLADVPLPKGVQVAVDVTERVGQTATPGVRTQEACTSAKIDLKDRDVRRKKEMLKRKWEEDEEDELSRLRYEALRSKTRRLMNDLKAERRRLKRERLRATIAMRRARERSVDTSVDEILLADTSDTSETDDSEDYSPSHKRKLLKRKRYGGREALIVHSNTNKICGLKRRVIDDGNIKQQQKQHQNAMSSENREQLESNAPNNLILELQQRIGGSNEGALALLEQLKKCLIGGAVSSNIHLNPEIIRKNA
ncbi:hypothetical protein LOAG_16683 [Loa loa]|uniref:Trithorax group protein osa n=1 Tax=Loa loa TaxID=7209 RepID=A0A1I7VUE2_LOALO|nr:hypothetical protein LOAG_16683 [Loa loa]EJD76335.1 hypothetical protein LOAG_16683 [Loa loa]